ncbi:hypothetical protein H0X06_04790 [Candidatus Dependentiae bacterium]|nr:hypothetical protein [Candidatus Dependentiae bacterium]
MKNYALITLFIVLMTGASAVAFGRGYRRHSGATLEPQTNAERLARNYIPQPYPTSRAQRHQPYFRGNTYYSNSPYYGDTIDLGTDIGSTTGATNEPEHLGID